MRNRNIGLMIFVLLFILEGSLASDNCTDFWQQWEVSFCNTCLWNNNQTIEIFETNYSIIFDCNNQPPNTEAVNCGNVLFNNILELTMKNCEFSDFKIRKILQDQNITTIKLVYNENSLPVNILFDNMFALESIYIYGSRTGGQFELEFGSQLPSLYSLEIENHDFTVFTQTPFLNLSNLRNLQLHNGTLQTLQDDMFKGLYNLSKLDLSYNQLKTLKLSVFENLPALYELILTGNHINYVQADQFSYASLEILHLGYNSLKAVPIDFFWHMPNVRILDISGNLDIKSLPKGVFKGMKQLENLIASNCSLNFIEELFTSVQQLDFSHNYLRRIKNTTLNSLINLIEIDISHNPFISLCQLYPFGPGTSLRKVKANSCNLTEFPDSLFSYNLSVLELSHNKMNNIILPVYTEYKTKVFLYYNDIVTINLYYESMLNNAPIYYLANNTLNCNCKLRTFLGVLHSPLQKNCHFIGDAEYLYCNGSENIRLVDVPWDKFICTGKFCQSICPCSKTILNCSGMLLDSIPTSFREGITTLHLENNNISELSNGDSQLWDSITHIYLNNNSLSSFNNWEIPLNLKTITLNNNKLSHIPLNLMRAVDENDDFEIYLAGNDWQCNCQSLPFKYWFLRNKDKIKDANETYCTLRIPGDGAFIFTQSLLLNIHDDHLCKRNVGLTVAVILVALMAAILTIGFYFYICPLKIGYFDVKR